MTDSNLDEKVKEFYELKVAPEQLPRMLFMDDSTKRIESAIRQYRGRFNLTIVTNVKECLRYLCRQEYDIVSLDHDLDGDDFQNPDDVTSGMEVVRYIVRCGGFPPSQIVVPEVWIHSSNLFAANLMINELIKVGIHAYYRKFEYDGDKQFGDAAPHPKNDFVSIAWVSNNHKAHCLGCGKLSILSKQFECKECYHRNIGFY
jgi:hypothetical protein